MSYRYYNMELSTTFQSYYTSLDHQNKMNPVFPACAGVVYPNGEYYRIIT